MISWRRHSPAADALLQGAYEYDGLYAPWIYQLINAHCAQTDLDAEDDDEAKTLMTAPRDEPQDASGLHHRMAER